MASYRPVLVTSLVSIAFACSSPSTTEEQQPDPQPQVEHQTPVTIIPDSPTEPRQLEEVVVTGQLARSAGKEMIYLSSADAAPSTPRLAIPAPHYQVEGRENYQDVETNGVKWANREPVSTFSVDVDTAAYANMRRQLNLGQRPDPDSIRVEELINYFAYDYPKVRDSDTPFSVYTEMGPSPWHEERRLVHIGINGWQADHDDNLPPANLVFLIDVSGSMQAPNKLPLLKSSMKMLVKQLRPEDTVAIAVYAGAAGEVLAPTSGSDKGKIYQAIDNLAAGGSTNGGAGIKLAYNLARQSLQEDSINRVILATDGDFNVGTTDIESLEKMVERERKSGVALTVLGFGTGNYNDHLMQKIAQIGNGNAAYIDTLNEARKVLVEELSATLNIIAKDMKVQVEFNPDMVETYRLIGYETRHLNREDFNNDKVDAGDVGAGHTVTALYEITLKGEQSVADPLRYGKAPATVSENFSDEVAFVKLRYKRPNEDTSRLITQALKLSDINDRVDETSRNYRFSAAVAWLGQHLQGSEHLLNDNVDDIIRLAQSAKGQDPFGYRHEFINLVRTAAALES